MMITRTSLIAAGKTLGLAVALSFGALLPASAQSHVYTLNNTFADSNGGPSLVANGGTLSTSGYSFAANQGLSLSTALSDGTNYSLSLTFSLTDITSGNTYKKLVDFNGLADDAGLYVYQSKLDFYSATGTPGTFLFAPDQPVTVSLTRDGATNIVTGSVDGLQQFSFVDDTGIAVFKTADKTINFLADDSATSGREASSGTVTRITLDSSPVPEASTTISFGLMLAFGGAVVAARKKKAAN